MRYVPTDEFAPILRRLLTSYDGEQLSIVAEKAEVPVDSIDALLRQRRQGCDFNVADRLLCALGGQHLWWGELAHIYYAIDLEFYDRTYEVRLHICGKGHSTMAKVGTNGYTNCAICDRAGTKRFRARQKELREKAKAA